MRLFQVYLSLRNPRMAVLGVVLSRTSVKIKLAIRTTPKCDTPLRTMRGIKALSFATQEAYAY